MKISQGVCEKKGLKSENGLVYSNNIFKVFSSRVVWFCF